MSTLNFVPLNELGYAEFCKWFKNEDLRRRISPPTPVWLNYVQQTCGVYAWMVYDDAQVVGEVQIDIITSDTGTTGYISFVVNPALWHQGWCKRILREALSLPELSKLSVIEAHVELDNIASQRCLQAVGFSETNGSDEAEMLIYISRN